MAGVIKVKCRLSKAWFNKIKILDLAQYSFYGNLWLEKRFENLAALVHVVSAITYALPGVGVSAG